MNYLIAQEAKCSASTLLGICPLFWYEKLILTSVKTFGSQLVTGRRFSLAQSVLEINRAFQVQKVLYFNFRYGTYFCNLK